MNNTPYIQVRELAAQHESDELETCMEEQINTGSNSCVVEGDAERAMGILAKAGFVKSQQAQGKTMQEAMRELGKRIRQFTTEG